MAPGGKAHPPVWQYRVYHPLDYASRAQNTNLYVGHSGIERKTTNELNGQPELMEKRQMTQIDKSI